MVSEKELARLQARKEMLIAQCDLQRGILILECARLRTRLDWVERGSDFVHKAKPWLPFVAPVAGYFVARRWKTVLGFASRAVGSRLLWRLFRL